jgi:hypothetical protein
MAYRFTNTDKWNDCWFSSLKPIEKILFNYLCDNCDIAGFIEVNFKNWASFIGTDKRTIEGALKGLQRGLIYSTEKDCIFIRNYLKHQKNLPLVPEKNPSHRGIIKRFDIYSQKFDIQDYVKFIEGASKGLSSPTGNGNGNGNTFIEPKKIFNYSEFYDLELSNTTDENYLNFVKWLFGENEIKEPFKKCLSLKHQIGYYQYLNLRKIAKENGTLLMDKIRTLENKFDKYKPTSLNLTLITWLKMSFKK